MAVDRYVKIVLTVIALELFWIGIRDVAPPVSAQAAATPVIIRGIDLGNAGGAFLPVAAVGGRPLKVESDEPLRVEVQRPVKIETDRPIQVESIPFTPSRRPGE